MPRMAHHRRDHRLGPENRWAQRRARLLAIVVRALRASQGLVDVTVNRSPGIYEIPPAALVRLQVALDEAFECFPDDEGRSWE